MTIYNLGNIKGEKGDKGDSVTGPTGPVGVGIKSIEQITYMKFKFCLTDGSEYIINYGDEPTFDGISVSSTQDVLSYADGDSTVLSAQLTSSGSPVSVSGESVTFEVRKQSDDSLVETLSDTTDNTGLASVEYFGKGVGDLYVKCQCRSVIETYEVEDCIDYQQMTDNSKESRWSIPSAVSSSSIFGYSSDGWKFGNASSYSSMPLDTVLDYPFSVEFKLIDRNNLSPIVLFANTNNNYIGLSYGNGGNWFGYANSGGGMSTGNVNYNLVNGSVIRLELTSSSIKTYVDDNLIDTRSHSLNPTDLHYNFQTGGNRWNVIKDFKIKPL